jgi:hypothetical protein
MRIALCIAVLLLCAGIESNPGPSKYDELASKIDELIDEIKTANRESKERFDTLSRDVSSRFISCEASIASMKSSVDQLKIDSSDHASTIAKLVSEIASLKSVHTVSPSLNIDCFPPLNQSVLPKLPADAGSIYAINEIANELKRRDEKKLNVIVFGLAQNPGTDDDAIFESIARMELGLTPHIVKTQRLGKSNNGKPPPLLVSLRDMEDKKNLLLNAKKLRLSSSTAIKDHVFINADLTLQERQQGAALRKELKLRKEAGETDIGIRAGKIIQLNKKH